LKMKKKKLTGGIFIVGIIIVVGLIFLFYSGESKEKEDELSPEFIEWFEQYEEKWDFNYSYINCIFEKTCNGTFYLEVFVNPEENILEITEYLSDYGAIERISGNSINFETDDPYKIDFIIHLSYIDEIELGLIRSDYKVASDEELYSCEISEDCIKVLSGCCGCRDHTTLNKDYVNDWNSLKEFSCYDTLCVAIACITGWTYYTEPECIDNTCQLIYDQKWICEADFSDICLNNIPQNKWDESKIWVGDKSLLCSDILELCDIDYENITEENSTLIIDINEPTDNSNVTTEKIYIRAITNNDSTCQYSWTARFPDSTGWFSAREMNVTTGTYHSQLLENLREGDYIIKLNCIDESGNSQVSYVTFKVDISFPDMYNLTKRYWKFIGDGVGSPLLTRSDMPNLLKDYKFYSGENMDVSSTNVLWVKGKPIENSTSNGDLDSPQVLLEVGTNANEPLFHYRLIFNKAVNFSTMHLGEYMVILGDYYKVQEGSTNNKIILRKWNDDKDIILEDNQPIKVNDEIINGAKVDINNDWGTVTGMDIYLAMHDPNKDYILVGEHYDDTIFHSLRLNFKSYSNETGAEIYLESAKGGV